MGQDARVFYFAMLAGHRPSTLEHIDAVFERNGPGRETDGSSEQYAITMGSVQNLPERRWFIDVEVPGDVIPPLMIDHTEA